MSYRVNVGMQPFRSLHVISGLEPAHGGPSYTVPRLCSALCEAGAEASLYSIAGSAERSSLPHSGVYFRQDLSRVPLIRKLRLSRGLVCALNASASNVDVIHNHGLWLMPNVEAGRAAARAGKPLIVTPRGMLASAALTFSPVKKRVFWTLLQGEVVHRASCIHATSESEHDEIRSFGLKNPIAVIPNGIDLPLAVVSNGEPCDRVVLSLGRIHPKKGLDRLIRAWAEIEAANPEWRLRIVGPDEAGYKKELLALAAQLKTRRVSIEESVSGDLKLAAYKDAELFVLPTLNENFGITVAEALASGTPVIVTKGAPWQSLERAGCGWWIDHGVEPLAAALNEAMAMSREALIGMGRRGRVWMERDFSWARVALDMLALYHWVVARGEPPNTVRLK